MRSTSSRKAAGSSGLPMSRRRTFATAIHGLRSLDADCAPASCLRRPIRGGSVPEQRRLSGHGQPLTDDADSENPHPGRRRDGCCSGSFGAAGIGGCSTSFGAFPERAPNCRARLKGKIHARRHLPSRRVGRVERVDQSSRPGAAANPSPQRPIMSLMSGFGLIRFRHVFRSKPVLLPCCTCCIGSTAGRG